ncbi:uncharacterized protein LOC107434636 isoform X1 [Ziziphus jujuba]|uniref:Uncharacterized protein LOC107434636 isoform X1 n=1 Tax=Ziziphus jujuba TaxID=326968 RepID=A0A6P4AS43_ZIZJJ|nr:uncharacterized protein LOC107434636 isoform X1 [Ziziphus jujuba]
MSRREDRDSDSKRHRSRFDREPSPKRSRRDGKPAPERLPSNSNLDFRNHTDQDQKHRRQLQDGLPLGSSLTSDARLDKGAVTKEPDRKSNGLEEGTKHSSNPTEVPRSRSYFQHDERGNAGQVGRSSGWGAASERGWWRDSRDQHKERTENKAGTNDTWQQDERAKGDEKDSWNHGGFFEMEADPPPARKRPAFREKKIQAHSGSADKASADTVKSSYLDLPSESGKREERGYSGRHLDSSEKPFSGDKAAPYRRETQRTGFLSRERYGGGGDGNYKGRDRYSGGRRGYCSNGTQVEKWKHDLYHEANRSPTPKNEEDQIAKVEALLGS